MADTITYLRADFQHLRRWRKSVEQAQRYTFKAVITVIVAGVLGAVWLGIKLTLGNDRASWLAFRTAFPAWDLRRRGIGLCREIVRLAGAWPSAGCFELRAFFLVAKQHDEPVDRKLNNVPDTGG
jgi:hypothetical protein